MRTVLQYKQSDMELNFAIQKCPPLKNQHCRSLQLTFCCPLQQLPNKIGPIMHDLKDKQLVKCMLIPKCPIQPKYKNVVLGGTFDYLHIGHQLLLLTALSMARQTIFVGITGDKLLVNKKNKPIIQCIQVRKQQVYNYIKRVRPQIDVELFEINDPFGPAIVRQDFESIAVSLQTKQGAEKINEIRKQRKLKQLKIEICPLIIESEETKMQAKISSSYIRNYILTKNGMSLEQFVWYKDKWVTLNQRVFKNFGIEISFQHVEIWWNRILTQYSQYWRYYHTNHHILSMLRQFQKQRPALKISQLDSLVIQLGIWFHDVQYIPYAKNNQEKSAQTALNYLKGIIGTHNKNQKIQQLAEQVNEAILATKHHKSQRLATKILIDLDMAILDSSHQAYKVYANAIKMQYEPIVKQSYGKKRQEFLKNLKIDQIFYFRKHTNLKNNIDFELQMLNDSAHKKSEEL